MKSYKDQYNKVKDTYKRLLNMKLEHCEGNKILCSQLVDAAFTFNDPCKYWVENTANQFLSLLRGEC